jgi:nucleoid-associated protein YgaU
MKTSKYKKRNLGTTFLGVFLTIIVLSFFYTGYKNYIAENKGQIDQQAETDIAKEIHIYIVVQGDSLSKIAKNTYGDSNKWKMLAEKNEISNPDKIVAGMKLILPEKEEIMLSDEDTLLSEFSSPKTQNTLNSYIVKKGDCLWNIAKTIYQDGTKWSQIAAINKLKNPDLIHSGNVLLLP